MPTVARHHDGVTPEQILHACRLLNDCGTKPTIKSTLRRAVRVVDLSGCPIDIQPVYGHGKRHCKTVTSFPDRP